MAVCADAFYLCVSAFPADFQILPNRGRACPLSPVRGKLLQSSVKSKVTYPYIEGVIKCLILDFFLYDGKKVVFKDLSIEKNRY